jgi:hypothetical protein
MGCSFLALTEFELLGSNDPPASASILAETISVCHHTQEILLFFFRNKQSLEWIK